MNDLRPAPGVNIGAPLIYMWEISDSSNQVVGRYIGKANGGEKRPTQHYTRNVNKLLRGVPYKQGKTYRRVHFALADAVIAGHRISLSYLCNVPENQDILAVEMRYIREYRCDVDDGVGLNGTWKGTQRELLPRSPFWNIAPSVQTEEQVLPDLEDFLEYVEENYAGIFEIKPRTRRYSLWVNGSRILRAFQSGPAGKVRLKRAQSSIGKKTVEFEWDGSDRQLKVALEAELQLFRQRQADCGNTNP